MCVTMVNRSFHIPNAQKRGTRHGKRITHWKPAAAPASRTGDCSSTHARCQDAHWCTACRADDLEVGRFPVPEPAQFQRHGVVPTALVQLHEQGFRFDACRPDAHDRFEDTRRSGTHGLDTYRFDSNEPENACRLDAHDRFKDSCRSGAHGLNTHGLNTHGLNTHGLDTYRFDSNGLEHARRLPSCRRKSATTVIGSPVVSWAHWLDAFRRSSDWRSSDWRSSDWRSSDWRTPECCIQDCCSRE
jgi:hypothetical protein